LSSNEDITAEATEAPDRDGFTLVELLIALALTLVIVSSLATTFIFQQESYDVQQQINEMNQNARAALDIMSRDIMMTGYGIVKSNYSNLSSWINWVSGVTFGTGPMVVQPGSGDSPESGGSDIIHVAGCFDGLAATLSSNASAGDTTIDVTPIHGTTSDSFDTSDEKVICINGLENALVTGVSGNTLTIDTDPGTAGNQGLANNYDVSATTVDICVIKVISYSIVRDADGSYTLKRNENLGAGRQPLAENIVNLTISQSGDSIEINPLTAQTDKRDPDYSENNGHRRRSFRSYLTPPNLTY
jgi:type IV pilus assembly protein PilW